MQALFLVASLLTLQGDPSIRDAGSLRRVDPVAGEGRCEAVIVDGYPLVHTEQILPASFEGSSDAQAADVLRRLSSVLGAAGSDLRRAVKLNVYVSDPAALRAVRGAIRKAFPGEARPAVAVSETALPHPRALVAMDAVAVREEPAKSVRRIGGRAAILPPGARLHLSGEPGRGTLAEATRQSLELLNASLEFAGLDRTRIVQLKAFLQPMSKVDVVKKELIQFFGPGGVPPSVFVEWQSSKDMPIEIEMIAWAGPAGGSSGRVEYLTPPGRKSSAVYSHLVRVSGLPMIYVSGLYGSGSDAESQIRTLYASLGRVLAKCGSDMRHLVKGTYYPVGPDTSRRFGQIRREVYDPKRPPAASKALVDRVGKDGKLITLDMVAVVPDPAR